MSAIRKVTGGAVAAVALTFGGVGVLLSNAGAQEVGANAGAEEPVNPTAATTTTTVTGLGSAGAATTTTVAKSATAATATTVAVAAGGVSATTVASAAAAEVAAELPVTGSDVGTPVKVGAGLGALGLGALLVARRRRPASAAV